MFKDDIKSGGLPLTTATTGHHPGVPRRPVGKARTQSASIRMRADEDLRRRQPVFIHRPPGEPWKGYSVSEYSSTIFEREDLLWRQPAAGKAIKYSVSQYSRTIFDQVDLHRRRPAIGKAIMYSVSGIRMLYYDKWNAYSGGHRFLFWKR